MTECKNEQLEFQDLKQRQVVAAFDGGNVTSDAGALLLREAAIGCGIIDRFAACFTDHRNPDLLEYTVREWQGQRVFGLCLG